MKKQTYEGWVTAFVERLSDYFNLCGWVIVIEKVNKSKDNTYAEIDINSTYMHATLRLFKQGELDFKAGKTERLVMALVHELTHIFLDPFQEWMHKYLSISTTPMFMDDLEAQTQKLTMVFLKNLPTDIIPPR
jgi:hypothetical protein